MTLDHTETEKERWDREYAAGRWDFLAGLRQQAKSGIIAAWLRQATAMDHVLDVGCGEGLLHPFLVPYGLGAYEGVDISPVALEKARARIGDVALHEFALEDFPVPETPTYSAILFNEVFHFPQHPDEEIRRYKPSLKTGGVIIVSMYQPDKPQSSAHRRIKAIWDETDGPAYEVLDDLNIRGEAQGVTFRMRLVQVL
ncbi:MAG: class I SAM-dependent methyltransferase [Pseudomonadota bacterium]